MTQSQYDAFKRAIDQSIANAPYYNVLGAGNGINCTQWAVRMWRAAGLPEEYGFSVMENTGNPYLQSLWRNVHNDVARAERLYQYGPGRISPIWAKNTDGCLKVGIVAICVDESRAPPLLRNPSSQAAPEKSAAPPPQTVPFKPVSDIVGAIQAVNNLYERITTVAPASRHPPPQSEAPQPIQRAVEPFGIPDMPAAIRKMGWRVEADWNDRWLSGRKHQVQSIEEKFCMPGSPLYPNDMVYVLSREEWRRNDAVNLAFAGVKQKDFYNNAAHRPVMLDLVKKLIDMNNLALSFDDMQRLHRERMFARWRIDWPMNMHKAEIMHPTTNATQRAIFDRELMLSGSYCYVALGNVRVIPLGLTKKLITVSSLVFYVMHPYSFFELPGIDRYYGHWNKKRMKLVPDHAPRPPGVGHWANFEVYEGTDVYANDAVMYPIWSSTYRRWQDRHHQGGDMLLFSEAGHLSLDQSIEFKIDNNV